MEHIVRKYLWEQRLTEPGQRILVALSGGADSTALLLCLRALGYDTAAAHLNHCLRGSESDRDEDFVRALCARLDVPLTVERADVRAHAAAQKTGIEEAARHLRYAFLEETADRVGADRIATAHTADDNLETVLFHLVRGTGAQGMAGIPPCRGRIIRPLLHVTRDKIEAYLAEQGQDYVTDSSNLTDHHTRNRIRHQVVPALREIAPHAARSAVRMCEQVRRDTECLEQLAESCRIPNALIENGEAVIDRRALRDLHEALQSRVLRQTLERLGLPMTAVSARHIEMLLRLLRHNGETDLPDGWMACTEGTKLSVFRRPPGWEPIPIGCGTHSLPNGRVLRVEKAGKNTGFNNPFNTFLADHDKIDIASLTVRPAAATDRLELAKYRGARTVRCLCDDCRIPRAQRRNLAALADNKGLIAVEGIGLDRSREGDGIEKIEIFFGGSQK
ncbi:MAG: tRNA lysidine(34) synthetase TilS [Butyricicoccus sp.]|nr:tRNA lysidine(34) synthetase TilS [Butyricicoccus sp.]